MSQGESGQGKRFKAGIVGAGHIAEFHIQALKRIPFVDIVGVVDLDRSKAEALAGKFGLTTAASVAELRAAGANVIHVLTPPHTHAAVATEALRSGAHVFVEKPLATDPEDCVRLRDLGRAQGLEVGVSHSLLYDPQIRSALEAVRKGAIGDIVGVDILRSSMYPPYAGRAAPAAVPHGRLSLPRPRHPRPLRARGLSRSHREGRRHLARRLRRSEPRLQRLARAGALRPRARADPALLGDEAPAAPDHHPGLEGRGAPRSVPDVPGLAPAGAAAEAGRADRQRAHRFDSAARRRAPQRGGVCP